MADKKISELEVAEVLATDLLPVARGDDNFAVTADTIADLVRDDLSDNTPGKGASLISLENGQTVQAAVMARPTSATLASSGGADLIGVADGATVQAKLDEFSNAIGGAAFSNTYASTTAALSNGVISTTSIVGGSGGTNGTFDLAFSGGAGTGAAGRFTVAGGALTSITITNPGTGYTSAPTLSFAASSGLTGASATAVIGARQPVGSYFYVPGASDVGLVLYRVDAGPVATQVNVSNPPDWAVRRQAQSFENATNGLAATSNGQFFAIPDTDPQNLKLYRNDSGNPTLVASGYPRTTVRIAYPLTDVVDIKGTLTPNEFVNATTGAIVTSQPNYDRTDYIEVFPGQELLYIGSSVGSGGAAFYNASKVFVSTAIQGSSGGGTETTIYKFTVPAGVKYIRASFKKVNALMYANAALYAMKGDLARNEVLAVAADVASVESALTETIDLLDGAVIYANTAINAIDGTAPTISGYEATGFLPVKLGQTIAIAGNVRNDIGFVAYDENQAFLSKIYRPSTDGGEITSYSYTVTNPAVKFIRICNRIAGGVTMAAVASSFYDLSELAGGGTDTAAIKVRFISSTEFHVDSRCPDGSYATHKWLYYDRATYSDRGWICTEIWHNGQYIVQGNYNTIHMMRDGASDDDMYVGILHGCEKFLWSQFYLDGVVFDPTTATSTIYGNVFEIQSLSEFYKPDKSDSLVADPTGTFTVAASPLTVRAQRISRMTIAGNNEIERHHKLLIKANGVYFDRLFGAMQQTMQAVINGVVSINDKDGTRNHFPGALDTAVALSPSTVVLQGEVYGTKNEFADTLTVQGGDTNYQYVVQTHAENADCSKRWKNNIFAYTAYTDRNKFYFQPVITSALDAAYADLTKDTFDNGDVIEMWSKTTIRVTKS